MDLWTFWDLPADKKAFLWSCQSWRFLNLWKLVQQSCKERRRKRTSNREPSFCRDVARPVIWNYLYAIIEIINETICIFEANVYDLFASARHVSKLNSRHKKKEQLLVTLREYFPVAWARRSCRNISSHEVELQLRLPRRWGAVQGPETVRKAVKIFHGMTAVTMKVN